MNYKWCAVPKCTNTSVKTPEKLFISVPRNVEVRRKWLQLSRRDPNEIANSTHIFFCEDHFDMENDMEIYYKYKMGFSKKIILKDKVLPSKFNCQPDRIKIMCDAGTSGSSCVKRQRVEPVTHFLFSELFQKYDKSTITESIVTVDKSVQCHSINKIHIRSKAVQTKFLTRDASNSPLKPSVMSSYTSPFKINPCFCHEKPSAPGSINVKKRINFMGDEKSESDVSLYKENPL
ncbi:uncharacterized protein LOC124538096 [Vanessa cardui]|uniref:uncharacterized protein LOC124538096 n=1 Tax=Vanessa cardui TaxID=171605 RepID=UPI001F1417BF|nr:uncharacterized protein LOC124538096 [Vanessa cardui]